MKTQVAIVGAGPSGLLLGALLHTHGIGNITIEPCGGEFVLGRKRAGVLEKITVDLLAEAGIDARMRAEGLPHDLMDQRAAQQQPTVYATQDVSVHDFDASKPCVRQLKDGVAHEIECDFIAGRHRQAPDDRAVDRGEHCATAPLRSFVTVPMCFGRLFLAGDAVHIVPSTGAKGLNLAASDVALLSRGLAEHYRGRDEGIEQYSRRALARIWKAERFSWWFTMLMHKFPENGESGEKMQRAELDDLFSSCAVEMAVAENYVGLAL